MWAVGSYPNIIERESSETIPILLNPIEIFSALPRQGPILVAVSGGSDSMALLLLANAWSAHTGVDLQVVTVDHGLRPEAAAEASFVAGTCEGLNVPHVTLAWEGLKPSAGLPEASREARYQLLEEFAEDIGASVILTAHTADDQAETVWMRMQRDNGAHAGMGLSGMALRTSMPKGCLLFRPLLPYSRGILRQYLQQHSQSWVEDPSNFDFAYERVRVRNKLSEQPVLASRLLDFASVCGRLRSQLSNEVGQFLEKHTQFKAGLVILVDQSHFEIQPKIVQRRILQTLLAVVGGGERSPSFSKVAPVLQWLTASDGDEAKSKRMTCSRCLLVKQRGGFSIFRESRNLLPMLLSSNDRATWDGRFEISNDTNRNLYVGALDKVLLDELEAIHNRKFAVSPRGALLSLPVFRFDDDETVIPFINLGKMPRGIQIKPICGPLEYYSPGFDEALSAWFLTYRRSLLENLPAQY